MMEDSFHVDVKAERQDSTKKCFGKFCRSIFRQLKPCGSGIKLREMRTFRLRQARDKKEFMFCDNSILKRNSKNSWRRRKVRTYENCSGPLRFHSGLKQHKVQVYGSFFLIRKSQQILKRAILNRCKLLLLVESFSSPNGQMFSCLRCSKVFHSRSLCLGHISLHFEKYLPCYQIPRENKISKSKYADDFGAVSGGLMEETGEITKCLHCDVDVLLSDKMLLEHMISCHPQVTYSCHHCSYKTRLRHVLDRHQLTQHKRRKMCPICGKSCARSESLAIHMLLIHKIQNSKIAHKLQRCSEPGCGYVCMYRRRVEEHALKHREAKPLGCDLCGKTFKHDKGLQRHKLVLHDGIRPFVCDICGRAYGQEGELKMHIARHNLNKDHVCHLCSYSTQYKGNLQSHLFKIHQVISNQKMFVFSCDQCSYVTNRRGRFNDHVKKVHQNIVDIPCPICNKMFSTKQNLYGHMTAVHKPKNFQCTYCAYSTGISTTLKQHVRIMHTQRDVKDYECVLCGFRSATSGNCRKHIQRLHTDSRISPKYVGLPRVRNRGGKNDVSQQLQF